MVIGATLLVDGVRNLVDAEAGQTRLSLTIIGFATGFEFVVFAWSSARRGISEAVVAGVVGSYAYNATMTLGAAALVKPLRISDAAPLRLPMLAMLIALATVLVLASRDHSLRRNHGWFLLAKFLPAGGRCRPWPPWAASTRPGLGPMSCAPGFPASWPRSDADTGESLGNLPLLSAHAEAARAMYILEAGARRARFGTPGLWAWRMVRYARLRWPLQGRSLTKPEAARPTRICPGAR